MLNEKSFNGALKAIKGQSEKLAETIHEAGLFAISQANEHGNDGFAVRLVEAMGKKHAAQAVVTWLCTYGKLGVKKGVLVYRARKDIVPENLDAWLVKATEHPYWEKLEKKELAFSVDLLAGLENLLNRYSQAKTKEAEGKEVNIAHAEMVNAIVKMVADNKAMVKPASEVVPA